MCIPERIWSNGRRKTTVHTELGAVYVLGDFEVVQRGDRWTIVPAARYVRWQELERWHWRAVHPVEMKYAKRFKVNALPEKAIT